MPITNKTKTSEQIFTKLQQLQCKNLGHNMRKKERKKGCTKQENSTNTERSKPQLQVLEVEEEIYLLEVEEKRYAC
jgi:hypothetical protein